MGSAACTVLDDLLSYRGQSWTYVNIFTYSSFNITLILQYWWEIEFEKNHFHPKYIINLFIALMLIVYCV